MQAVGTVNVGFYGKLPSHGDFLRRRVSDAFVSVWDSWLQDCIAASRTLLTDRWLDLYLTSPAWRFACARGTFGMAPVVGVMAPSVDRVGRYFHLTVVAELPEAVSPLLAARLDTFFDSAQRLVIDTLATDPVDFDAFDEAVCGLGQEVELQLQTPRLALDTAAEIVLGDGSQRRWQVPMGSSAELGPVLEQLAAHRLAKLYDPLVLLWTDGSAVVEPSCLITKGLPHPNAFAALLDGAWSAAEWHPIAAVGVDVPSLEPEPLIEDPVPPRYRSAGATDVGRARRVNQDSMLERTDVGLWAVADGLGGHSGGEVASRMVCDALADFVPDASFEQMVDAAGERLHQVNEHLVRSAAQSPNGAITGSTVVALMARGTRCAILWAGDSRVYRVRDEQLTQLTRDHSVAELEELTSGSSNVVTRAVGGEATLTLDLYRDRVRAGDRFLLCSDGLTRTVPEAQIRQLVAHGDIQTAVEALIGATLDAGAPDNVTVVVVEAYS